MTQEGNCLGKDFSQMAIVNHCVLLTTTSSQYKKPVSIELLQQVDGLKRWLMSCHGLLTLDNHLIFTNIKGCKLYCCNNMLLIWRDNTVICFWSHTIKRNIACAFWFIARHLNINAACKKYCFVYLMSVKRPSSWLFSQTTEKKFVSNSLCFLIYCTSSQHKRSM